MTIQITDFTICTASFSKASLPLLLLYKTLQFILGVALLCFAVFRVLKQSFEMYKATKQWQPNKYLQQLVTDGIIYFLVYVLLFHTHPQVSGTDRLNFCFPLQKCVFQWCCFDSTGKWNDR